MVFIVARSVILIKKTVFLPGTGMLVCIVKYSCLFLGSQRLLEARNLFPLFLLVNSPTNRNLYIVTPQIDSSGTILVITGYPDPNINCPYTTLRT